MRVRSSTNDLQMSYNLQSIKEGSHSHIVNHVDMLGNNAGTANVCQWEEAAQHSYKIICGMFMEAMRLVLRGYSKAGIAGHGERQKNRSATLMAVATETPVNML